MHLRCHFICAAARVVILIESQCSCVYSHEYSTFICSAIIAYIHTYTYMYIHKIVKHHVFSIARALCATVTQKYAATNNYFFPSRPAIWIQQFNFPRPARSLTFVWRVFRSLRTSLFRSLLHANSRGSHA